VKIGSIRVFKKHESAPADALAQKLASWAKDKGIDCVGTSEGELECAADPDLLVVLGGDGTFLSAVRWLGGRQIPLLGVNLGSLGFLTEITTGELFTALEKLLNGEGLVESRMTLHGTVERDGRVVSKFSVLNDVVFNKGALARISEIEVSVDGLFLTTYRADGLVISSPTGSTAYSLSAGGAIVHPSLSSILLSPICPHAMTNRPIVLCDTSVLEVKLREKNGELFVTLDGQVGIELEAGDVVKVSRGVSDVLMIRSPSMDYYSLLRSKLLWGDRKSRRGTGD